MNELKPCPDPDCGCLDVQVHCGQPGCHWVACRACGLQTADKSRERVVAQWNRLPRTAPDDVVEAKFQMGDKVTKISGSNWTGRVVGTYSTALTPEGYAVESAFEKGSVQIYPAKALRHFYSEAARKAALQSRPSPDSDVVDSDCSCQAYPTHCANDCPIHGLEPPFDGVPEASLQSRPADNTGLVGDLAERINECNRLQPLSIEHECACNELADFVLIRQASILTALRSNHDEVVEKCAMTHDEAIDAICGCAQTVTVLSYQEAIEGYLKLRGWQQ